MARTNLDERLINFAVEVLKIAEKMDKSYAGSHLSGQLKIVLKELRETIIGLKIVQRANLYSFADYLESTISENNELISIFVTSIETATKNIAAEKTKSTSIKLK